MEFANTLRGLAAICVVIQHYFVGFWSVPGVIGGLLNVAPAPSSVPASLAWIAPPDPFAWGAFGVALFFVISGFVIPFSLAKLSAGSFLVGRLFRIFPVYVAGFTITLLSLWCVERYFGANWPFDAAHIAVHYVPGLRDLTGAASIDGIIWTLDIEVKFYLLCALGAPLFRRRGALVLILPLAAALLSWTTSRLSGATSDPALLAVASALSHDGAYIVFMSIGTVFYLLHVGSIRIRPAVATMLTLAIVHLALLAIGSDPSQLLTAPNYALAVVVFAGASQLPKLFGSNRVTDFFASISYPLYAVHAVTGWAVLRVLIDRNVPAWFALMVATGLAIAIAWLLHIVVEAPFHQLGRRLGRQMAGPAPIARGSAVAAAIRSKAQA